MDKRQSSARQVDWRMMHRSRCFRMIEDDSGRPQVTDLLISRTTDLLPSMPYLAEKCTTSRGTRRETSGFQKKRVCCTCWRDVWLSGFPGQSWDVNNVLRLYSQITTKAECGLHSGRGGDCSILKMVSSACHTQPRMVWAGELSAIFNSIKMGRCGPQPMLALAGLKMVASP